MIKINSSDMTDELRDKSISSVMTDEIFAGSKQYIYRRIWKVRLRWGKGEVKRNDVMALKVAPKIPKMILKMILK